MINKSIIDKMLDLPDDKMVMMLKIILSNSGMDLPDKQIDSKTVAKIRAVLSEVTDEDIGRVSYLAERFRNGGHNGKR